MSKPELRGIVNVAASHGASFKNFNCRIGKKYFQVCVPGKVCFPVEGSFATECAHCDRFC